MGFSEWLKNNYPGKSRAIKSTTERVLKEYIVALEEFAQENPDMPLKEILQNPNFHNKFILKEWTGKKLGSAGKIMPEIPDNFKEDSYLLLLHIVWNIVKFELSYDPTFGTEKDTKAVMKIVKDFIKEFSQSANVKS